VINALRGVVSYGGSRISVAGRKVPSVPRIAAAMVWQTDEPKQQLLHQKNVHSLVFLAVREEISF